MIPLNHVIKNSTKMFPVWKNLVLAISRLVTMYLELWDVRLPDGEERHLPIPLSLVSLKLRVAGKKRLPT